MTQLTNLLQTILLSPKQKDKKNDVSELVCIVAPEYKFSLAPFCCSRDILALIRMWLRNSNQVLVGVAHEEDPDVDWSSLDQDSEV